MCLDGGVVKTLVNRDEWAQRRTLSLTRRGTKSTTSRPKKKMLSPLPKSYAPLLPSPLPYTSTLTVSRASSLYRTAAAPASCLFQSTRAGGASSSSTSPPPPNFCCCFVMPRTPRKMGSPRLLHPSDSHYPSRPWHAYIVKPCSKEPAAPSLRPNQLSSSPSPPSFLPSSLPFSHRHHGQQQLHLPGDRHREASHRCRHQGGV